MKTILLLLCFIGIHPALAGISVVSDLDDTIKITNSGSKVDAAINGVFSDQIFSGMNDFLSALEMYTNEIHIISASPSILRPKITLSLKKRKIKFQSLILRESLRQDMFDFKVESLKKVFDSTSDDFILIGDDVGKDPEVYEKISKLYPGRVLTSYIHVVTARNIGSSHVRYWTSLDLFLREFQAKRMSTSWVEAGAYKIINEPNLALVFPDFANCPTDPKVWKWQTRTIFEREANWVADKLISYCKLN